MTVDYQNKKQDGSRGWKELRRRINKWFRIIGMLIMLNLALPGCTSTFNPVQSSRLLVTIGRSFPIITSDSAHGWGYLSHPFIYEYAVHGFMVDYNLGGDVFGGGITPDELQKKGPAFSKDGGKTWIFGAEGRESLPYWRAGLPSSRTIEIRDESKRYQTSISAISSRHSTIFRGRGTWILDNQVVAEEFDVTINLPKSGNGFLSDRGVALSDGTLLFAAYTKLIGELKYSTLLLRSVDQGRTWNTSLIASAADAPWGGEGPSEPALILCKNGDLLCVMRTGYDVAMGRFKAAGDGVTGPMLLSRSRDGGETWEHEKMLVPGVMPKLYRMSNDVLVLAFGRPGNNLIFSLDDGRSWGNEISLSPRDVNTSGYCDIVEVEPGKLLAVYDMYDTDARGIWLWEPKMVNGILGRFINVRRLW